MRRFGGGSMPVVAAILATLTVIGGALAFVFTSSSSTPANGLASGVQRDLTPTHHLSASGLANAASIIGDRLKALGVHSAHVAVSDGYLKASVPAASLATLSAVATTKGQLRFRRALALETRTPPGTPTPNASTHQRNVTHAPTLSKALKRTYAEANCKKDPNPTKGRDATSDYMIACSTDGTTKFLLAPTAVPGRDITSASSGLDSTSGKQWVVNLAFNGRGANAWLKVTKTAYNVNDGQPSTSCHPPKGCNAISITLDGVVESAPYISTAGGIPGGRAEISGDFTQQSADRLAGILKYGALPSTFAVRTPTPTH
jgi:preprotein translocase subunit SecD